VEHGWIYSDRENPKYARETGLSATLSTTSLTWIDVGSNTGPRSEKPISNRLSHGTTVRADFNLYEPCVLYIGRAHRYPPNTPFHVFFQLIYVLNFLNMLHTLHFFSSKCHLLHNATFFGSCIVRILHTGCAKIEMANSGAKKLNRTVFKVEFVLRSKH
jgi:hypothetical protein